MAGIMERVKSPNCEYACVGFKIGFSFLKVSSLAFSCFLSTAAGNNNVMSPGRMVPIAYSEPSSDTQSHAAFCSQGSGVQSGVAVDRAKHGLSQV